MVKRNIVYNTVFQLLNVIIPIITAPYLARMLGSAAIGVSSYSFAVSGYFVMFAMLGLNNYGSRSIALNKENQEGLRRYFCEIYTIQLITSMLAIFLYILFLIFNYRSIYFAAYLCSLIYIVSALFDVNWFFYGLGEFKLITTRNVIVKLVSTILIFLFVRENDVAVYIYICIHTVTFLVSNILVWTQLQKYTGFQIKTYSSIKKHIKPIISLFIPVLAVSIYKMMDKIMLKHLSDMTQTGYYECAANIVTMPLSVITAMGTVMLPKVSELVKNKEFDKIEKYNLDSIQIMLAGTIPFALGIVCVSDTFVNLYFGSDFSECAGVLQILALSSPFVAIGNVLRTQYIIPRKCDSVYVIATILGAIVNLILNLFLIPLYGARGAAVGTLAAEAIVMLYQFFKMKRYIKMGTVIKDNYIFLVAGFMMFCFVTLIKGVCNKLLLITLVVQIISGIILYLLIILLYFRIFDKEKLYYWLGNLKIKKGKSFNENKNLLKGSSKE